MNDTPRDQVPLSARALIGVARRDITPPIGIYARHWGAAAHDVAGGIHRPLCATVMVLRETDDSVPLLLASVDASWWQRTEDEYLVRGGLIELLGLDAARVMVALTHTHASASICAEDSDKPGGHLIGPYLRRIRDALIEAGREALQTVRPAVVTWKIGRCGLATNRDMPDPNGSRYVCGFNPVDAADDALLVGRVTDASGRILASIVNYACHPTILAWKNDLISPDYVGAMREVIEAQTAGAPCLFLQGASGELAPRECHSNNPAIADAAGRQLGFAVLSALESMLPPATGLTFGEIVESGAPLAAWRRRAFEPPARMTALQFNVELPLKGGLPPQDELQDQMNASTDRNQKERLRRRLRIVRRLGTADTCRMPVWTWLVGQAFFVGHPNEAYSLLQTQLRNRFPNHAVVVINVVNGHTGYLCPPELHDLDIYPVWQSPFGREALMRLIEACEDRMMQLLEEAGDTKVEG